MRKVLTLLLSCVGLIGVFAAWEVISFISSPAQQVRKEIIFEIPNGTAFYRVSQKLEENGLVKNARLFNWTAKFLRQTTRLKVGEYRLFTDMRPRDVLRVLTSGQSITYPFTVPEGFNIFEIRDQLNQMWPGRGDEFFALVTNQKFIKQLTATDLPSLEGYLFPETYLLTKYTSMETLVRRMHDYFLENITEINTKAKIKMPLHEQVTLASVIEKETGAAGERQLISSVFHNRLRGGMRLQSDPTILYGLLAETKEMRKNITKSDIMKPTPYNTYTVKALPLGPIANPGRDALWAAVSPVDSKYFYFVSRNDGTHVFSESYLEHAKAVRTFQLNRKMREGKSWRDLKNKKAKNSTDEKRP